jgi:hypothetical protein
MSVRSVRLWLWLALVLALPVPIWLLGPGSVPVGHLAELGAAAVAFGAAESFRGVVGLTAAVFLGQSLVYAALLYAVAALIARVFGRFPGPILALAASLVIAACFVRIYHSPYHASAAQVTLFSVYQ